MQPRGGHCGLQTSPARAGSVGCVCRPDTAASWLMRLPGLLSVPRRPRSADTLLNEDSAMTVAAKALPGVRLLLAWGLVLGGTSPFFAQQDDPLPRRMLGQVNAAGAVVYTMDARGLATGGLTAEDNPQQTQTGMAGTVRRRGAGPERRPRSGGRAAPFAGIDAVHRQRDRRVRRRRHERFESRPAPGA